jgi:hypothetical protein
MAYRDSPILKMLRGTDILRFEGYVIGDQWVKMRIEKQLKVFRQQKSCEKVNIWMLPEMQPDV